MIVGIGTDITEVKRFVKWVKDENMLNRFFNQQELKENGTLSARCQHYAVRFAAKEAFSKALGTGISGFELKDIFIQSDKEGKPYFVVQNSAEKLLKHRCGECTLHVTLSHEKEYAVAFVVIEKNEK